MKNLKKVSRENLKSIKGGITPECATWWGSGQPYYSNETTCLQAAQANDPNGDFHSCHNACGRWYIMW